MIMCRKMGGKTRKMALRDVQNKTKIYTLVKSYIDLDL
jgi:hypothetical protein